MDNVIKVRRSFLNELRGFCNRFAGMCDGCFRRPCDCPMADTIHLAKNLIFRIDNIRDAEEERYYIDNPFAKRCDQIVKAIRQAGKPIPARMIRVDCGRSRSDKTYALGYMARRGTIVEIPGEDGGRSLYSLPEWAN